MSRSAAILGALGGLFFTCGAAQAATITVRFSAVVSAVHDDFGVLPGVTRGGVVTGSLSFDGSTPDNNDSAIQGGYPQSGPEAILRPGSVAFDVGSVHFRMNNFPPECDYSIGCYSTILVTDTFAPVDDSWMYQSVRDYQVHSPLIDAFSLTLVGVDILSSDAISVPGLAGTRFASIYYVARDERLQSIPPLRYSEFTANISALEVTVPEPGPVLLLSALAAAIGMRRRVA